MRRSRILKTRFFHRWALRAGLIDGDLGGGVIKKRVGVQGRGKSGGARIVLATNRVNERQIDAQTKSGALKEVVG